MASIGIGGGRERSGYSLVLRLGLGNNAVMTYQPPFELTPTMVNQISAIAELVERPDGL